MPRSKTIPAIPFEFKEAVSRLLRVAPPKKNRKPRKRHITEARIHSKERPVE
jgi:hypothetical protein